MTTQSVVYSSEQTLTVTNLHSLANSATAGWSSARVDNTTDKYLDALVEVVLDPANTAPANSKAFFVFVFGAQASGSEHTTGASSGGAPGSEGALTFPDITANPQNMPLAKTLPYLAADVAQKALFSVCAALGVPVLPPYWGVAILNHSGAALAASGNTVKWRGIKLEAV